MRIALCWWLVVVAAGAQDNPVSNGSFEEAGPTGAAVGWSHVGLTVDYSPVARTGARSLRLVRERGLVGEIGFNRDWIGNSGQQGAMLAERRGALIFWYQVLAADGAEMQFQAIPMNADGWEKTDSPRDIAAVPASHAGDGRWHRAVLCYDFTADPLVKWVHVSGRIVGSGSAEVLVDDVSYAPSFGPLPAISNVRVLPGRPDRFTDGTLTAMITNAGDAPSGPLALAVAAPPGLTVGPPSAAVSGLAPDRFVRVSWPLTGRLRAGGRIAITAPTDGEPVEGSVALKPELSLEAVLLDPAAPVIGEPLEVTALIDNRGNAAADLRVLGQPTGCTPAGPATLALRADPTDPRRTVATWRLTPVDPRGGVRLSVVDGETVAAVAEVPISARRRETAAWTELTPGLELATVDGRAVGRVLRDGQVVAELPHLGQVRYRSGDALVTVPAGPVTVAGGVATSTVRDGRGRRWTFKLFAAPGPIDGTTRVTSIIRCDQPAELVALCGLDLLLPGRRGEALMPGLEWLAPGELSGNDFDIERDHPQRKRCTPHPNRVTIPYLSAVTDRATVGLMWDMRDRWWRGLDRPQPVFASPDRDSHRAATRLGLMAPNVPAGLPENQYETTRPWRLAAGEPVTLRATVYAGPPASPLAVQAAWFGCYQPEPVAPLPRGSAGAELELSARALLDTLWQPEQQSWLPFKLGPAVMRQPTRSPLYAFDLLIFSKLVPESPLAAAARERAGLISRLEARPPAADDWGYLSGDPLSNLEAGISQGVGQLASADERGIWTYQPPLQNEGVFKGLDYLILGEPGQEGDGLFANRLMNALRPARLVGATELFDDAARSLDALEGYTIPRAAQVWEVPVHTPDILAAAEACEAFCEAYQLTGDRRWLDAARAEAYGGLAFIYVWNEPGKLFMRFGSIPVMGATLRSHSWFGNLVQWNGLSYARALLRLARLDGTPPPLGGLTWEQIARGIMVSAMYQQREDEGEYYALWPDSLHTIDGTRALWEFAPRQILEIHHTLLGRLESPQTVLLAHGSSTPRALAFDRVTRGQRTVTISAPAQVSAAAWTGDVLRATFRQPAAPLAVRATFAGLDRPSEVLIDGRPVEQVDRLGGRTAPGWAYHAEGCALAVVLPEAGEATVELRGAVPKRGTWRPTPADRLEFTFDTGNQGWRPHNHLAEPTVEAGVLRLQATGPDPYLVRDGCNLAPDTVRRVRVRMRSSHAGWGQFYWTTTTSPAYAEDKVLLFEVTAGEPRDYVLDVGDQPLWRGQRITGVRLDPLNGVPEASFEIDSIVGEP